MIEDPPVKPTRGIVRYVILTALFMVVLMFIFSVVLTGLRPDISLWDSQLSMILFSSLFAAMIVYFILKEYRSLASQVQAISDESDRRGVELREKEEELASIFQASPAMILITRAHDGVILEANDAFLKTFGYSRSQLLGHTAQDLHLFSNEDDAARLTQQSEHDSTDTQVGYACRTRAGESIHILLSSRNIVFQREPCLLNVAIDISWRKKIETELLDSTEKFQAIFEYAPDAFYLYDFFGNFIDGNKAAEVLVGYKREDLIGKSFLKLSLIQKEHIPRAAFALAQNALHQPAGPDEYNIVRKDGTVRMIEARSYPVKIKGKWVVLGISRDITERKKTESELTKFQLGLERTSDAIFITDPDGAITYVNPGFTKLYGFTPDETIGKTPRILKGGVSPTSVYDSFWKKILNRETVQGEFTNKTKQQDFVTVDATTVPILDASGILTGFLAIQRDITEKKKSEIELQRSKKLLDQTGKIARVGGWELYVDNKDLLWTQETYRIHELPYSFRPTLERAISFYAPSAQETIRDAFDASMARGTPFDLELPFLSNSGKKLWVRTIGEADSVKGKIVRVHGTFQDITERKHAEQMQDALFQISEAAHARITLDELYSSIHAIIGALIHAENFYIALHDETTEMLTFPYFVDTRDKLPSSKRFGKGLTEYVLRTGRSFLCNADVLQRMMASGEVEPFGSPPEYWLGVPLRVAERIIGVIVVQSYNPQTTLGEREKEILQFVSNQIALAIERKQAEQELEENARQLRAVVETVEEGITLSDQANRFLIFNTKMEELTGYSVQEAMHTPDFFLQLYPDREERAKAIQYVQDLIASGKVSDVETTIRTKRDQRKTLLVSSTVLQLKGQQLFLSAYRDITQRKSAEQQIQQYANELKQLNASKDTFFSIISHDLRSPFSTLLGFIDLLESGFVMASDATRMDYIRRISILTKQIFALLDNLLQWSRLQRGVMEFEPVYFPLERFISTFIVLLKERATKKQLELSVSIPTDLCITADENMLRSIIQNLLTNAIKFTPAGGSVHLTVEKNDQHVLFTIEDTGVGMSASTVNKLFRIDVHHSTQGTEREKGTGLGLILCKEFVEKHGGTISVRSEEEKGSTFCFTIPERVT